LEGIGLDVVVEAVEPGAPNIIAVLHGESEGPCLMFECHTDVVTEGMPLSGNMLLLREVGGEPNLWKRSL